MSLEDALAQAADLLHCAVGTAHSSGEAMDVQQRAVMHLVEMAKGWWIGRWSVCSLDERPITNVERRCSVRTRDASSNAH